MFGDKLKSINKPKNTQLLVAVTDNNKQMS